MEVFHVLRKIAGEPISVASNFARDHAVSVALAASIGWITVVEPDGGTYSRIWKMTLPGLHALETRSP
jgi:hypothetical protein